MPKAIKLEYAFSSILFKFYYKLNFFIVRS